MSESDASPQTKIPEIQKVGQSDPNTESVDAVSRSLIRDRALRRSVFASVIAAIIVILFVQPVIDRMLALGSHTWATMWQSYSDSIYANAALGDANTPAYRLFEAFSTFLIVSSWGLFLVTVLLHRLVTRLEDGKPVVIRSASKRWRLEMVVILICFLFGSIGIVRGVAVEFTRMQLNASFRQRVRVIGPFLTERDEKELLAMWASMRNKSDYDRINAKLESVAQMNKVSLPTLLPGAR